MAKEVVFPAMNAEGEAKLKRLLATVGEIMGDDIKTEAVIVLKGSVPDDREDMRAVMKKIADGLKRPPKPIKPEKPGKPE
jgi:hypothetical protein